MVVRRWTGLLAVAAAAIALRAGAAPLPALDSPAKERYADFGSTAAARALNLPAAWDFVRSKERAEGEVVTVGVLDVGFEPHSGLEQRIVHGGDAAHASHGNAVAGVVAAALGRGTGADRSPSVRILSYALDPPVPSARVGLEAKIDDRLSVFSGVVPAFERLVSLGARVINVSLGYRWCAAYGGDFDADAEPSNEDQRAIRAAVRESVQRAGREVRALARAHPGVVIVSAAGNECDFGPVCSRSARWSSPFNWAALANDDGPPPPNIFVVQGNSARDPGSRYPTSNAGATIAAVGESIPSVSSGEGYAFATGTSVAAPQITALVALILVVNPSLTVGEIRCVLGVGRPEVPDALAVLARTRSREMARSRPWHAQRIVAGMRQ